MAARRAERTTKADLRPPFEHRNEHHVCDPDTANQKRDDDLRGPDFFSVKEFPTLSFKSTSVKSAGENKMEVTGDLTIHGQTKPITVTLEHVGTADTRMGHRTGFAGEFTIKRTDFGMSKMTDMVSDDVTIMIGLEAKK